ncbi:MAG: hypothetical protein H6606_08250 [Flavobacteriales bacterium]|nr:hypothetical protein [Flavobacteriales bacterium]
MRNILRDPEFWAILAFNVLLLIAFIEDLTGFDTIVVLFFLQNLFIGLQYFVRLIFNGFRTFPGKITQALSLALFFGFGYGLFHFVYSIFLISIVTKIPGPLNGQIIRISALLMLGNMLFSLISDLKKDAESGSIGGLLFFFPFIRVLPMHIFIILAFNSTTRGNADSMFRALLLFMALKTAADLLMHIILNQTWLERRPPVIAGKV